MSDLKWFFGVLLLVATIVAIWALLAATERVPGYDPSDAAQSVSNAPGP